jgi:hypothetical protein
LGLGPDGVWEECGCHSLVRWISGRRGGMQDSQEYHSKPRLD